MLTALMLMTLAAPGDAIYILKPTTPVVLTTPQKIGELANALAATFPGIPPASLDRFSCQANPPEPANRKAINLAEMAASLPWPCQAIDSNPSTTAEAALDYELTTGGMCQIKRIKKGKVIVRILFCRIAAMSSDAKILNEALTQSVFSSPLNLNWDYLCERNGDDPSEVACVRRPIKIASPEVWEADSDAGNVPGPAWGRVAPAS